MDILTEAEAAQKLRMSVKTLKRRRSAGQIGHIRDGRRVLYRPEHLNAYLDAVEVAASAPPPAPPTPRYRRAGARSGANLEALLDLL
jgi:excisionase family DNA binding protein